MKKVLLIVAFILGFITSECFGQYPSSYSDAVNKIKTEHRYGLIFLSASWCQPCQKFEYETLAKYYSVLSQYYVFYVVDIDKEPAAKQVFLRANNGKLWNGSVPAYFLLSRDMKYTLVTGYGYKSPQEFARWYNTYVIPAVQKYDNWLKNQATPQYPIRPYQTMPSGG